MTAVRASQQLRVVAVGDDVSRQWAQFRGVSKSRRDQLHGNNRLDEEIVASNVDFGGLWFKGDVLASQGGAPKIHTFAQSYRHVIGPPHVLAQLASFHD